MKTPALLVPSRRFPVSLAAIFGSVVFGATPAFATDDARKFQQADADSSGDLTLAEFRSTLSKGSDDDKVLKKFGRADQDGNSLVTLEEWIAYKQEIEDESNDRAKYTAVFNSADLDDDGFLTFDEFKPLYGKKSFLDGRKRFLKADADADTLVSLAEWLVFKDDRLPDDTRKVRKFDIVDLDGDGELTPAEFSQLFPRKKDAAKALKKFNKEDTNDDGVLTRDEWNPKDDDSSAF